MSGDDLRKIAPALLVGGALRMAGGLISRYAARATATRAGAATRTAFNTAGRVGRSNALGAVGLGTTLYGAYDMQRTAAESESYRSEIAARRREMNEQAPRRWWQRPRRAGDTSSSQALSDAQKDADNDGVPGERELPEDQRNYRRGGPRTT